MPYYFVFLFRLPFKTVSPLIGQLEKPFAGAEDFGDNAFMALK